MKPTLTNDTKLIGLSVYRAGYDCTNGGVSGVANTVYIPHHQGYMQVKDVAAPLIFLPEQRGPNYWALKPAFELPEGDPRTIGPMDGGNLATSCDARCNGIIYHIHDRFETPEDYRVLSR